MSHKAAKRARAIRHEVTADTTSGELVEILKGKGGIASLKPGGRRDRIVKRALHRIDLSRA